MKIVNYGAPIYMMLSIFLLVLHNLLSSIYYVYSSSRVTSIKKKLVKLSKFCVF